MDKEIETNNFNELWFVLTTKTNKESEVFNKLLTLDFECYLPLNRFLMFWGDKQKWIIKPLFQGFLFVKTTKQNFDIILKIKHVKDFVRKLNKPVNMPDEHIDFIKRVIATKESFEIKKFKITKGNKVLIDIGPLKGLVVQKIKYGGQEKAAINFPSINYAILIDANSRLFQYSEVPISKILMLN